MRTGFKECKCHIATGNAGDVNAAIELSIKNGAIKKGQIWSFDYFEDDPFKETKRDIFKILDLQNGYIEYQSLSTKEIESMDAITFIKIFKYHKVQK